MQIVIVSQHGRALTLHANIENQYNNKLAQH